MRPCSFCDRPGALYCHNCRVAYIRELMAPRQPSLWRRFWARFIGVEL